MNAMNAIEYANARAAIARRRQAEQERLDNEAMRARATHIHRLQEMATEGESPENEARYLVAIAVANTISVGREDGYPTVNLPDEIKALIHEAADAEVLVQDDSFDYPIGALRYNRQSAQIKKIDEHNHDYQAWNAAREYRRIQPEN